MLIIAVMIVTMSTTKYRLSTGSLTDKVSAVVPLAFCRHQIFDRPRPKDHRDLNSLDNQSFDPVGEEIGHFCLSLTIPLESHSGYSHPERCQ